MKQRGSRTKIRYRVSSWLVPMAALVALSLAAVFVHRRLAPLLSGDLGGDYTTRVYSTPYRIRVGDPLSEAALALRLRRLRYEPASGEPGRAGEYREIPGSAGSAVFQVRLRGFSHPFVRATPVFAEIGIESNEVRSLREADSGVPLVEAALEPELIYEISGPKRIRRRKLRGEDIPPFMIPALVAIEDKRFFQHHGIDLHGMARAAWRDLRSLRMSEGASTITQQLARTLFLSQRRTFSRKAAEALCAFYLEMRFSKTEIARMYLDSVYFGQNGPVSIVGLYAASRHFFDKEPKDLTLGECAMLAGLLRSPYYYNPFRNPDEALRRRRLVLLAMRDQGFISGAEETSALLEPLRVTKNGQSAPRPADYFIAYIQRKLEQGYDDAALLTRGLTIYTTLDPLMQEAAQRAVSRARQQAALVALDPGSGAIRALVGGKDYVSSPFDRATLARRQPGSAFKPFVYGAALESRPSLGGSWTPASWLMDEPRRYRIEGRGEWIPRNYDRLWHGRVTLRAGLAHSLNGATVDLARQIGPQRIIDYARNLGISSPLRPELGMALGIFEVNLLELTAAYCPFDNGGSRVEPYAVEAALDSAGEMLEYHSVRLQRAISPAEAYLMTSLLRGVVAEGTGQPLKRWGLDDISAGKTGTTDDGKDAWFIGYTPRLAAGVWTGSDRPTGLGMTGASAALPVWADFMRSVSSRDGSLRRSGELWPRPDGVVTVEIDPESGLLARMGCPQRKEEIFLAGTEPRKDCPLHPGGVAGWLRRIFHKDEPKPRPARWQ